MHKKFNRHFQKKMQISAILCFATCDWFCPMTSHVDAVKGSAGPVKTKGTCRVLGDIEGVYHLLIL